MEGKNHKDKKVIYYSNTVIEENLEQVSHRNKGKQTMVHFKGRSYQERVKRAFL